MTSDKNYLVTFYKTVSTSYGCDREIQEDMVEVRAPDERLALERAKADFCSRKQLSAWTDHADRCEVRCRGRS